MEQDDYTALRTANHLKRIIDIPGMGIVVHIQQINYGKRLVYAHQGFSAGINVAFYQRQVGGIHGLVQIGNEAELAVCGLDGTFHHALDQTLSTATVMNEIGNRPDLELMLYREFNQIRQASHTAIFFQYFANDCCGGKSGEVCQIATRLSVPGANKHAAGLRHEGENVPRLNEVFRLRVLVRCGLNGAGAVGG